MGRGAPGVCRGWSKDTGGRSPQSPGGLKAPTETDRTTQSSRVSLFETRRSTFPVFGDHSQWKWTVPGVPVSKSGGTIETPT